MSGKVMFVCRRFILTAWLLSLVPSVPNLFIFTTEYSKQGNEECVSDFSAWNTTLKKGYFSLVFLVIFVIPLVNMIIIILLSSATLLTGIIVINKP